MSRRFVCRKVSSLQTQGPIRRGVSFKKNGILPFPRPQAMVPASAGATALLMPPTHLNPRTNPMASIHKDIPLDAAPDRVWDAVRDFGAVHTRLAPGFVTNSKLDGDARIVTF